MVPNRTAARVTVTRAAVVASGGFGAPSGDAPPCYAGGTVARRSSSFVTTLHARSGTMISWCPVIS